MRINRVEDLLCWKAARVLCQLVNKITDGPEFQSDLALYRQMRNAAASVMANITEGFESGSDREFARFLKIAKRSAAEVQSHLYVALDRGLISKKDFDAGYEQGNSVKRLIGGFIRYLNKPRRRRPVSHA